MPGLIALLLIALGAAALGFGLVAGISPQTATLVFFVFLILAVLALITGYRRRPMDYF
jgi:uncharacterized membrane protein YtjA (UPF0391 family)